MNKIDGLVVHLQLLNIITLDTLKMNLKHKMARSSTKHGALLYLLLAENGFCPEANIQDPSATMKRKGGSKLDRESVNPTLPNLH